MKLSWPMSLIIFGLLCQLYPLRAQTSNLDHAKAAGVEDRKGVNIIHGESTKAASIVPLEAAISDYEAYKAYAKALSHHQQTLPEAIELFRLLSEYNPSDLALYWEYNKVLLSIGEDQHDSLVPKQALSNCFSLL